MYKFSLNAMQAKQQAVICLTSNTASNMQYLVHNAALSAVLVNTAYYTDDNCIVCYATNKTVATFTCTNKHITGYIVNNVAHTAALYAMFNKMLQVHALSTA